MAVSHLRTETGCYRGKHLGPGWGICVESTWLIFSAMEKVMHLVSQTQYESKHEKQK